MLVFDAIINWIPKVSESLSLLVIKSFEQGSQSSVFLIMIVSNLLLLEKKLSNLLCPQFLSLKLLDVFVQFNCLFDSVHVWLTQFVELLHVLLHRLWLLPILMS